MKEIDFIALDQKVEYLVALCQKLQDENRQLRHQEQLWRAENMKLAEKNEVALSKIQAMHYRLQNLEPES